MEVFEFIYGGMVYIEYRGKCSVRIEKKKEFC